MGVRLKVIRRKEPFAMITLRVFAGDKKRIEQVATANEATVTDVIISALVQTGVIPERADAAAANTAP